MRNRLSTYSSLWTRRLALYFSIYVVVIVSHLFFSRFDFWHTDVDSARYMLSSLIQSEAAIIALVVTLSLVAVQLAASSYSTRVVDVFIKTPDLWILILIYGIVMFYGLGVLKLIEKADPEKCAEIYVCQSNLEPHIALSYFLGVFAFVALIPYIWNTIRLLKPAPMFDILAENVTYQNILEAIKKTDTEDPLQPIVDIVSGSIMKYDYYTAKQGLMAIGSKANIIFKNEIRDKENEKTISDIILNHLTSIGLLAISKENEQSTNEVIFILSKIGITALEQANEEQVSDTITKIRKLGKKAANKKMEDSTSKACSYLAEIGEKSIEINLELYSMQGGKWEIDSLKEIGLISIEFGMKFAITNALGFIELLGNVAANNGLTDTTEMAISSLEAIGMEAGKYKNIEAVRSVKAFLINISQAISNDKGLKKGFFYVNRRVIESLVKIDKILDSLELEKKV